jgi:hypothetical protein
MGGNRRAKEPDLGLYKRGDGNPLFIGQLLRHLVRVPSTRVAGAGRPRKRLGRSEYLARSTSSSNYVSRRSVITARRC